MESSLSMQKRSPSGIAQVHRPYIAIVGLSLVAGVLFGALTGAEWIGFLFTSVFSSRFSDADIYLYPSNPMIWKAMGALLGPVMGLMTLYLVLIVIKGKEFTKEVHIEFSRLNKVPPNLVKIYDRVGAVLVILFFAAFFFGIYDSYFLVKDGLVVNRPTSFMGDTVHEVSEIDSINQCRYTVASDGTVIGGITGFIRFRNGDIVSFSALPISYEDQREKIPTSLLALSGLSGVKVSNFLGCDSAGRVSRSN